MTNPTSNFGWQMPTSTDLVTDLPADFEVFGQAVDTTLVDLKGGTTGQVLAKASAADMDFVWSADAAGMTNPMTTTGDTIYSSPGSTPVRLGIGSTGNVLTVAGGVPTWAAPAANGSNYTLLNAGGTALTGAATITVSGLSGYDKFLVLIANSSSTGTSAFITLRLNADSGANYYANGALFIGATAYNQNNLASVNASGATSFDIGRMGTTATDNVAGSITIAGANSTGQKIVTVLGSGGSASGTQRGYAYSGRYNSSSVISSVSVLSDAGNFDAGTIFIYGSVA
jgi:hypothetical protein